MCSRSADKSITNRVQTDGRLCVGSLWPCVYVSDFQVFLRTSANSAISAIGAISDTFDPASIQHNNETPNRDTPQPESEHSEIQTALMLTYALPISHSRRACNDETHARREHKHTSTQNSARLIVTHIIICAREHCVVIMLTSRARAVVSLPRWS